MREDMTNGYQSFLVKMLLKLSVVGYKVVRQRGSHLRLKDSTNPSHKPIIVPLHKELKPGLLRKIIKDADLSVEELKAAGKITMKAFIN